VDVFGNYARYYDLLYRDKDYLGETQFIQNLIQTHAPKAKSILELGCGTGIHASLLAQQDYQVYGVDISHEMLQQASDRLSKLPAEVSSRLNFTHSDIRKIRLNQTFDVVISLFHVISYQTSNEDLTATLETVKQHLKPGGILIFDCWYGPAVLSDRPTVRVKRLEDDSIQVTRIAEPVMHPNTNLVDVNYHVFMKAKSSKAVEELHETHTMRYLFKPEIDQLCHSFQFKEIEFCEWITGSQAGFNTWNVYGIFRN
jgi:SAM-dependent methyltransferase